MLLDSSHNASADSMTRALSGFTPSFVSSVAIASLGGIVLFAFSAHAQRVTEPCQPLPRPLV